MRMKPVIVLTSVLVAGAAFAGPPATKIDPVTDDVQGTKITDNYRWLEAKEADSDDVKQWTTEQNDYTRKILDGLPFRHSLESRLSELMSMGSVGAPAMCANRYFYSERKGDENQAIVYVRTGYNGQPRELLNPNTLDDKGLYALDWYVPTDDGKFMAFGLSYAGSEMTVLHVMNVDSGT
ncbi:MAG TPA: hypothetical protein VG711_07800, partial [Phycisphaerales bacterium]|nr:hypothetical protein [Phycisphaerales bacterium]